MRACVRACVCVCACVRACVCAPSYQVALEPDELHAGLQVVVCAAADGLDVLHQVAAELVASLQNTQHHDVPVRDVLHDVARQTLDPAHRPITRHA